MSAQTTAHRYTQEMLAAEYHLTVSAQTDIGHVREKNEDAVVVADLTTGVRLGATPHARLAVGARGLLLAVSDGMGGAAKGDVASAVVVDVLSRAFIRLLKTRPDLPAQIRMDNAMQRAHNAVLELARQDRARMGATLTAVYLQGEEAFIGEVGDSRAYLIRSREITRLTHDQSLVQMLIDDGFMRDDDAEDSPLRNVILQGMGIQRELKTAITRLEVRDRDCLVVCSDGLTSLVSDDEIRDVILSRGRPELASRELIRMANERGGHDNTTVIVAGVGGCHAASGEYEKVEDTLEVLTTFEADIPNRARLRDAYLPPSTGGSQLKRPSRPRPAR